MIDRYLLLSVHLLGAAIWVGGHLVLALSVLPRALRARRATPVRDFEAAFERVGLSALAAQVITGTWLAYDLLGTPANWFDDNPTARTVLLKLALLLATGAFAVHARLRVIPRLTDATLPTLAWHILAVTLIGVALVVAGVSIRFGGYPLFAR